LKLGFTLINGEGLKGMTESPVIQEVVKKLDISNLSADEKEFEAFFNSLP
jgi:hypothetical protein